MASFDRTATTLDTLVRHIGATMVRPLWPPTTSAGSREHLWSSLVTSAVLHDPADPFPPVARAVVFVPGARLVDGVAGLLTTARTHDAAAIVVKQRGEDAADAIAAARRVRVPLLAADDDVAWDHLLSVTGSVLGTQAVGETEISPGEALFEVANATAVAAGGAVSIEDLDRSVVAYSSVPGQRLDRLREESILNRRVPDVPHNIERYSALFGSAHVQHFAPVDDTLARRAVAVRAGDRPLGSVWLVADAPPETADRALQEAADLAALHMLRRRTGAELRLPVREDAVRGALDGRWDARETERRLALRPGADLGLLAVAPVRDSGWLALMPFLSTALSRCAATFRPDAGTAESASAVYVLLPTGGSAGARRFAELALNELSRDFSDQPRIAVAGVPGGVADLPLARREVDDILRAGLADPSTPLICDLDTARGRILLDRVAVELAREPRLRHPGITRLLDHDAQHGTSHRATLLAWFEEAGDVRTAATRLGIHPNTLRYRLRTIPEQFGIDIVDPAERLSFWMQLHGTLSRAPERGEPT